MQVGAGDIYGFIGHNGAGKSTTLRILYTVLKSPHVNKKAQEQFEYRLHKRQISFYWFQSFKMLMLLKKVQTKLFPDVKIKIRFMLNTSKIKKVSQPKIGKNNNYYACIIKKVVHLSQQEVVDLLIG